MSSSSNTKDSAKVKGLKIANYYDDNKIFSRVQLIKSSLKDTLYSVFLIYVIANRSFFYVITKFIVLS